MKTLHTFLFGARKSIVALVVVLYGALGGVYAQPTSPMIPPGASVEDIILAYENNCPDKNTSEGVVPDKHEYHALLELYFRTNGPNWQSKAGWLVGCSATDFGAWPGVTVLMGDVVAIELPTNSLAGPLPNSLGRLKQLTALRLPGNALTGGIPDSVALLANLAALDLTDNQLTGPVSIRFGTYQQLQTLDIAENSLSGTLPHRLFTSPLLRRVNLSNNELTGSLPLSLTSRASLTCILLARNALSGELPTVWRKLLLLDTLDLSGNRFSGTVPVELANLPALRHLKLNTNRLRQCPNLAQLTVIERVNISGNAFDFGSLEPMFTGPDAVVLPLNTANNGFFYNNQTIATSPVRRTQSVDEPLVLALAMGGVQNRYQWEKHDGAVWQTINGATANQLTIAQPNLTADAGMYRCVITNTWVMDVTLYSPTTTVVLLPSTRYQAPATTDQNENANWNWTFERTFDGSGATPATSVVTGEGKQFMDGLGQSVQTQNRALTAQQILASQTIYNSSGQPVLSTLPAPINNQNFNFAEGFVRPSGSTTDYGPADFEVSPTASPAVLDTLTIGTLGHYYSHLNAQEPHTPATAYPFSLSETVDGPLGNVSRAMGPGETTHLGSGREARTGTVPILDELNHYAYHRSETFDLPVVANPLFQTANLTPPTPAQSYKLQGTKSVSIGPDGSESIAFTDKEGNTLATCRAVPLASTEGGQYTIGADISVAATAAAPAFLDIHVPAGGSMLTVYATGALTTGGVAGECRITNLVTGQPTVYQIGQYYLPPTLVNLAQGFYRITSLSSAQTFTYPVRYSDFSYTYYDVAGRPVASVAPSGIVYLDYTPPDIPAFPHVTKNTYSTTGQLLRSFDHDANLSEFVYRTDGTLRFSRHAEQARDKGQGVREFSYSNYDSLGRVIESGVYQTKDGISNRVAFQAHGSTPILANSVLDVNLLEDRTRAGGLNHTYCSQINSVWYDYPFNTELAGLGLPTTRQQRFVLGAVARTATTDFTTWYSYDDLGRLQWLVQRGPLGTKTIDYQYDVSGNVTEVAYQKGRPDVFYHYYAYDPDQRLRTVYASPDGINRTQLAHYDYYLHGPLKRAELADRLQGVDYRYTINGWLKSLNEVNLGPGYDPGHDHPNANGIEPDLFSLRLDYFAGDYRSGQQSAMLLPPAPTYTGAAIRPDRYDGTIHSATWHTPASETLHSVAYAYDTRSQFTGSMYGEQEGGSLGAPRHFIPSASNAYAEHQIAYDPNGNIKGLKRTDGAGFNTANYSYRYHPHNNRLEDIVPVTNGDPNSANNDQFFYNEIGETIHQRIDHEHRYLTYDASGKVTGVYRDAAHEDPLVTYTYDDRGFRASQTVKRELPLDPGDPEPGPGGGGGSLNNRTGGGVTVSYTTHYVRDAAGNVLSVYEQVGTNGIAQQTEVPLYAASRVGTRLRLTTAEADRNPNDPDGDFDQRYELTDHLGSARVVFHRPLVTTTPAGLELADAAREEANFDRLPGCRSRQKYLARTGTYVALLNPSNFEGPATELAVSTGDSVVFSAWAFVPDPATVQRPVAKLLLGTSAATAATAFLSNATTTSAGASGGPGGPEPTPLQPKGSAFGQVLRRLSVGLGFTLGGGSSGLKTSAQGPGGGGDPVPDADAGLQYKLVDSDGNPVDVGYQYVTTDALSGWVKIEIPLRIAQPGTLYLEVIGQRLGLPVLFDDIAVRHRGGLIVQEQHQYPYGAPITGLSYTVGNRRYRHGYQGQYTETDTTTGWASFELRLYDAKRARWTAPDPYGQYVSPYIAMGNDPVGGLDPDGGWLESLAGPGRRTATGAMSTWTGARAAVGGGLGVGKAIKTAGQAIGIAVRAVPQVAWSSLSAAGHGVNAARDWTSAFISDVASPSIVVLTSVAMPIINAGHQIGVSWKGFGYAWKNGVVWNRSENLPWAQPYKLNNWKLIPFYKGIMNYTEGNMPYEQGSELLRNTATVVIANGFKIVLPRLSTGLVKTSTEFIATKAAQYPLQKAKDKAAQYSLQKAKGKITDAGKGQND